MLCQLSDTVENHCGVSGGGLRNSFYCYNPMIFSISFCGRCRQPMVTQVSFKLHLINHYIQGSAKNLIVNFDKTLEDQNQQP